MIKSNIKEAVIAVTYRCNSRCRMCNIWQIRENRAEFHPNQLNSIPQNIKDINITGGEPFLRQDLVEIIKVLNRNNPKANIIISSNGFATKLIIGKIKEIIKFKPDIGVAVSLDGIGQAHNEIRRIEDGYNMAVTTIGLLKNAGVKKLKIGFTIGDYNISELKKVYELSQELGVELTIAAVHSSENYFGKENHIERKREIIGELEWLMHEELCCKNPKRWARAYFTHGLIEFLKNGKRILPDYSGRLSIFIDPRGAIYPCDVSTKVIGKLTNFGNIDSSEVAECASSWMICTARQAMKKHKFRVVGWIMVNKIKLLMLGKTS